MKHQCYVILLFALDWLANRWVGGQKVSVILPNPKSGLDFPKRMRDESRQTTYCEAIIHENTTTREFIFVSLDVLGTGPVLDQN